MYTSKLRDKLNEALRAVLPVVGIVLLLGCTIAPIPSGILMAFLVSSLFLIAGMMLFSLGAELAMEPMGERLGVQITRTRKLWLVMLLGFLMGALITVSEPDLSVLANQVQNVPNLVLILTVSVGVGLFLSVAISRMLFSVALPRMLVVFYGVVFLLALLVPKDFLAVAFDAGGVTTGPMTVPFIMSFGIGIASIRSDRHAAVDSFGLIALCSIGPILAVLLMGLCYRVDSASYTPILVQELQNSVVMGTHFWQTLLSYVHEIAISLAPIAGLFFLMQIPAYRSTRASILRILVGLAYTYIGLVLFLSGVQVGFLPTGVYLGETLASLPYRWLIVPIGMVIGYFIVLAEPAVYVLMNQVEEMTDGAIPGSALKTSLSISVAVSVGFALLRVLTGISILWFLIPGYIAAIGLSFFVPKIFTAIAFDSGGVASGPMTATFLLPFAEGACMAVGGNISTDAFGVVAMVAMTPLITLQALGLLYQLRERQHHRQKLLPVSSLERYGDYDIIEL